MNTERDNFYDWAKDKPDASSFAGLQHAHRTHTPVRNAMPWGRMVLFVAALVAVVAALKLFVL